MSRIFVRIGPVGRFIQVSTTHVLRVNKKNTLLFIILLHAEILYGKKFLPEKSEGTHSTVMERFLCIYIIIIMITTYASSYAVNGLIA